MSIKEKSPPKISDEDILIQYMEVKKMSDEFNSQVKALRACVDALGDIVAAMENLVQPEKTTAAAEAPQTIDFVEVRHRLALLAQAGHSQEVKELITRFGTTKLSEIDPSQYGDLLKAAKSIGKTEGIDNV